MKRVAKVRPFFVPNQSAFEPTTSKKPGSTSAEGAQHERSELILPPLPNMKRVAKVRPFYVPNQSAALLGPNEKKRFQPYGVAWLVQQVLTLCRMGV
jgi:hypothetical protein